MRILTRILPLLFFVLLFAGTTDDCNCDIKKVDSIIHSPTFNSLPTLDQLDELGFSKLSADDNMKLWYRDVESPEKTKYTSFWNDYSETNYHASQLEFVKFYENKKDVELAFQFGPNGDLWAYHVFVIKKVDCCYLATRSYFRHARFTGKRYAIIDKVKLDSLFTVLSKQSTLAIGEQESQDYSGYFRDNRNNRSYYINFEKAQTWERTPNDTSIKTLTTPASINQLYDFVDKKINWKVTYSL